MNRTRGINLALKWILVAVCAFMLPVQAGEGSRGKKVRLQGVVVERSGDSFVVQDLKGNRNLVRLTPQTQIEEKRSNFLRDPLRYAPQEVIRGLWVSVRGRVDAKGSVEARRVKFTQDDLSVARVVDTNLVPLERSLGRLQTGDAVLSGQLDEVSGMARQNRSGVRRAEQKADLALSEARKVQQGLTQTEERLASVRRSVSELDEFEVYRSLTLYFSAGSSTLSDEAQQELDRLATDWQKEGGYLLQVTGFASADGGEAYNRLLSQKRAEVVVSYLVDSHGVPIRKFIQPYGFGELRPAADNSTAEGRQRNRRVELKVLVNQGLRRIAQSGH